MMTLALLLLAMALGGACVVAWGCALRRDGAAAPRSGPLAGKARENDHAPSSSKGAAPAPSLARYQDTSDDPLRWPGPVLPDADAVARDIAKRKDRMEADWQTALRRQRDAREALREDIAEARRTTDRLPPEQRECLSAQLDPDPNSYEGRGFDPGETWQPKQRGETE